MTDELRVNGVVIDEDSIQEEAQFHAHATPQEARESAKRALVIGELCRQRARDLHLEIPDTHRVEEQQFVSWLINAEVTIAPPDEQSCIQYYQSKPHRFQTVPAIHAHHILLTAPKGDDAMHTRAQAQVKKIFDALQKGEPFAALAKQYSHCDSAKKGGDLGKLVYRRNCWQFEPLILLQQTGLVERAFWTTLGAHVIFVERCFPSEQLPFEQVQPAITRYLTERARRKAVLRYLHNLIETADIQGVTFKPRFSSLFED